MSNEEKYAEKIAALLRKAESTTPEEAELLVEKAQQLMTQYAISQAMLDSARGIERDEITQETFTLVGVYREAQGELLWQIGLANNCKAVLYKGNHGVTIDGKTYKCFIKYTLTGFTSDLKRVQMLWSSLQIQAATAQREWSKEGISGWYTSSDAWRARRDFISGFASAVGTRLRSANKAAQEEASKEEAARAESSVEAASESVALVLRSRKDRVEDWFDNHYGSSLRSARQSYRSTNYGAMESGRAAGSRADIGQGRVGGRRQIGS